MICPHCGSETRDTSAFCTQCGGALSGQTRAPQGPTAPTRAPQGPTNPQGPPPPAPSPPPPPPPSPPSPRGGFPVVPVAAGVVVVLAALVVAVAVASRDRTARTAPQSTVAVGPGGAVSTAEPLATPLPPPDCSQADHPAQGSAQRREILDALRRHYRYDGRYAVEFVTVYRGWAHLNAARYDERAEAPSEPFRAYLVRLVGDTWEWRWEGETGAEADSPGDPRYPSDFTGAARDVLRC